ncbi:hypothetical protein P9K38_19545 [Pseudomonas sp. 905_Psudmo1]|nr:hypothetical protein [Pseudomonas sp. 905_Psudmo1]WFS17623.1 hypothetical protein P9K38_19545 [Pseudomonas sp. 905_Psudmo1]
MYTLIDLNNENQADYLNSALRRHGLDSFVFKNGIDADGREIFSISCLNASELKQTRHLIYSCQYFISDIHPEAAISIREMRHQNNKIFSKFLTSKTVVVISSLALAAALLGYIFDL